MASGARIPSTRITGIFGALVKRFAKRQLGSVPEPLGVYWHQPQVLKFYLALGQKSRRWSACDPQLKSFAHMAVAGLVGCSWCLDYGYFMARNEGLDLEKAREIPRWRTSDAFTALERDVLAYAEAMTCTPPNVTDALAARLLEALGPAALVELTAFIALANQYTRVNVAVGIEAEGYAAACGLAPLAERSVPALDVARQA